MEKRLAEREILKGPRVLSRLAGLSVGASLLAKNAQAMRSFWVNEVALNSSRASSLQKALTDWL
jgi:hypothetical protein